MKEQILREYCRRSFYNFVKLVWKEVETQQFLDNWHIKVMCDALQKRFEANLAGIIDKDININVPPGSTKSLICSVMYPAWIWLVKPSTKIISASYSHKIAEELAYKSLLILNSEIYKMMCNFSLKTNNVTFLRNNCRGYRFVTSSTGSVTGVHADVIILDDINSPQSIHSSADRETARKFVQEIIPTRLTSPKLSFTIYIQQRLHFEDATSFLKNVHNIIISAINENGESFFPQRFSIDFFNSIKDKIGSRNFEAQYMQKVVNEDGGILKRSWFKVEEVEYANGMAYAIDSAYGLTKGDYTGVVCGYKKNNMIYIYRAERNKYQFPELISYIKKNIPFASKIYIEGKASGKSIIQSLQRETNLHVIEVQPNGNKLQRKHALSPLFESGRVIFDSSCKLVIEELTNDNSKNDDVADACMYLIEKLNENSGEYIII
jgi:predicted phage terminase large subunit-like protein